jgi:serine/threonine-protein phosphatase 6 regulatory ankyrin repeat subunit B
MHEHVQNGDFNIVYYLLSIGYNINQKNSFNLSTPLIDAIISGQDAIAFCLIKKGADLNIQDKDGFTALMTAINCGNEKIANMLIRYGADVNIADNIGITALMIASSMGSTDMVCKLIQRGANVHAVNHGGETALTNAMQENHRKVISILKNAMR